MSSDSIFSSEAETNGVFLGETSRITHTILVGPETPHLLPKSDLVYLCLNLDLRSVGG